jgi:uncharacterized OB-fold protein
MEPIACPYCLTERIEEQGEFEFNNGSERLLLTEHSCAECGELFYTT